MDTNLERKNSEYAQFLFQHGDVLDANDPKIGYFTQKTIVGDIFGVKIPKVYMKSGFKINDVYELSFMNDEGAWENIIHEDGSIEMIPQAASSTPSGLKWYQNVLPGKDKTKKLIVFYRADGKYHFMGVFKWDEKCFTRPKYKVLEKISSTIAKSDIQ